MALATATLVAASLLGALLGLSWTLPNLSLLVLALVLLILAGNRYHTLDRTMKVMITVLSVLTVTGAIVAAEEREISLYERYRKFVSYGYYLAQRTAA